MTLNKQIFGLSPWHGVWQIGFRLILIAGVFSPSGAFAVSRTYFMYFNAGTTLSQPAVTTNTTCPTSNDTQLNGVSGIGLMDDIDNTTCVPASNRDVIWDAANTKLSLYYKGTGYTSSMNVTGTSVGVRIRAVTTTGTVTVVKLFYTTSGNNKVYFTGTPPTQVATTTRTSYTINLSGLSATNVPAGSKIGVEFSWPSAPSGMRLSVNQGISNEKLIVDETATATSTPSPIAEYRMDESVWNGTTSEVIDNSGSFSGTAASFSSTKPTSVSTTPAISGNPGTCSYGVFNRTNKDYIALPSSFPNLGASGDAFTITAWIRTTDNTQSGQRILIDDEHNTSGYGFSVGDGGTGMVRFFSRGTPSALILDTANVIANNNWYFVAAVVDVPNKIKHIYVYNSGGTLLANVSMSWTETSFGSDTGIASIGGETNTATENNNAFGFAGNIDEVKVYQAVLDITALNLLHQSTHICGTGGGVASNPVNFNCIESGANASTGHLYTKLAGSPFSFEVTALKSDGSVEIGFVSTANKNVTVELVDGSGTTACASRAALSPAVSQTLSFTAADQGRKAIAPITLGEAHSNLRCRVTDTNQSPSIIGCSTDNFAVRPASFSVTSSINADVTGISTSAIPTIKTGANFTLLATSGAAGYNNAPQLDASKITAHTGSIQNGILTGSFAVADVTTGTATGGTFTYSEAGYFQLAANGVFDDSFTTVDSATNDCTNDFSNVLVSGKYGCKFGNAAATNYFGRFIPDHFVVTQGLATPACGTVFTYFGQDGFTTSFTLTAQNASNAATQNYTGSFAKLALIAWNNFVFTSAGLPAGSTLSASATAPTGNWSNGVADVIAKHQVNRPTALTGQTTVTVNTSPVDTDGVTMVTAPVAPGTPLRYGRVNLGNAHGSELLDLAVPMQVEYFNGTSFITNTDDVCSVSGISITDPLSTDNLVPADSCIWDDNSTSGSFKCATAAPTGTTYREASSLSAGNFNLNLKPPGKTGALDITATVDNWLQFDWHGTGTTNPSARATFGIYKGNQKIIYFREVY